MKLSRRAALLGALLPIAAQAADPEATASIQALDQALLANMRDGQATPFTQRYATLGPVIDRTFDLPTILRLSVGPAWGTMPPDQQTALLGVFRKFTVVQYVANFSKNDGTQFQIVPENRSLGADQVVATRVVPTSGDPTRIDYVMRRTPAGWRAIDVLLNGSISQVAVNRSDWRSSLTSGAGPLISNLQRKVASLSGGAVT